MFNYAIHHALALVPPLADDLCHPTKPQKMCVSFSRLEGTPRLLQTLNGWIQTGTFFFFLFSSKRPGHRSQVRVGVGWGSAWLPGRSSPARQSQWCSLDCANGPESSSHYHNRTSSERRWATTRSFTAEMKSREPQRRDGLLLLWWSSVTVRSQCIVLHRVELWWRVVHTVCFSIYKRWTTGCV